MSNINVNTITPLAGTSGTISISGSLFVTGSITAEGNINLGDNVNDSINFVADVSSSILPDATDTYNLGSSAKRWKTIFAQTGSFDRISGSVTFTDLLTITSASISFLSGSSPITIASPLIPNIDDTHDLGTSTLQFKDLYLDGRAYIDTLNPSVAISGISSSVEVSGSITPKTTAVSNLGALGFLWKQAFLSTASMSTVSSSLIPVNDSLFDLGSTARAWNELYVDSIDLGGQGNISVGGSGRIDLDANDDTSIRASADNTITFEVGGTDQLNITDGVIASVTNNDVDLGSTTKEFKNLHLAGTASISVLTDTGASPTVDVSASLVPLIDGAFNLGSANFEWENLFIDGIALIDQIGSSTDGVATAHINHLSSSNDSSFISASVSLIPGIDDTYSLGAADREWKDLFIDGTANIDKLVAGSITASIVSASSLLIDTTLTASTDAAFYIVNGSRVEIRNQLQAQLDDGTFATLELRNTSITANSIVVGSFTGLTIGQITGSIITSPTTGTNTASIQFHNETGANIANDTTFTASFVIL